MDFINFLQLTVAPYLRKSSDSEDKQVQSIETQEREVEAMSERFGFKLKKDHKYAETKSAFTLGRQEFERLINDIESGKINAIAVVHESRIARNAMDGARIIELMDRKKLLAIFTPAKIYLGNANDKMMLGWGFLVSKKDSDDKSAWVKGGLKTKALKGLPSGVAAIGFLNDMTNERGNRKWKVDIERFPLVQSLLLRFLEGNISGGQLHKYAIEQLKFTTPKHKRIGGALITRSRMFEILKDPICAGFFFQNGVRYELDASLPRMITEDEHQRILRLLGAKHKPRTKKYLGAYTGFIRGMDGEFIGQDPKMQLICDCKKKFAYLHRDRCPVCGVKIDEMKSPKDLEYTFYYNVRRKKSGLKAKHLNEKFVDAFVVNFAKNDLVMSSKLADWSRKHIRQLGDQEIREQKAMATRSTKIKESVEDRKARYREMLANKEITPEEYRTDVDRFEKEIPVVDEGAETERWLEKANDLIDLTQEFVEIIENGTVEAKRRVLTRLGSNLTWDEKKLNVINKKSVQALIDGLKHTKRENQQFEPKKSPDLSGSFRTFPVYMTSLLRG